MKEQAVIIFVKNPIAGKVKTRLARDVGDTKAVEIYKRLLQHTHDVVKDIDADKYIFYGDYINDDDLWGNGFEKKLQHGADLGERMLNAFKELFDAGYKRLLIIGSDCYELNVDIIKQGFQNLNNNNVVIGPTYDGGYYLLGMTALYNTFFENINWSTETVYGDTLKIIDGLQLSYKALQQLNDVDYVKDVPQNWL